MQLHQKNMGHDLKSIRTMRASFLWEAPDARRSNHLRPTHGFLAAQGFQALRQKAQRRHRRREAVQTTLAGGTVFQMDQAAPEDQDVLRLLGERREDATLDRRVRLLPPRHHPEGGGRGQGNARNSGNLKRVYFSENAHFTGVFES